LTYGVTGTLVPDATCNYHYVGMHEGKQAYRRLDGAYHIYWIEISARWYISVLLGDPGAAWWDRLDPNPAGLYGPQGTATGNATVIVGEHP